MNILRSEWTKLRSVRSTWIAALSTVVSGAALSLLSASGVLGTPPSELPGGWDPTAASLQGFIFAQLVIGMLGALSVTAEYDTGMIGTSLAAVPSRSRLLTAKLAVAAAIALGTGLATTLVSFTAVQIMFDGAGLPAAGIADPGVAGALVGAMLYLALIALLGAAVGTLTRSATSSLAVLVGALLIVPATGPGLPGVLGDWFARYWPITAGQASYTVVPAADMVAPALGFGILAATTAAAGIAGHTAFRVRDV
ncbi:ABC-type transport system involved in multi-copper enzyme maturation permease subunit [Lipingzhangella halophila]|uniref:ABC-type transport system involved in multi-copper enzyme maturation permease subunit n=1 Tax=Lipingzhangella halophila TaxID=1783352 RepID=A0A7W7RFL4_9ACTN|nr:ABC transporter permease [Lipingzhangella halophila]MBB4930521.1 ABC-type transport system involved in multi-copper enzyme maturation permease subunit [Lipingzhangella halophila]